jgi:hypothetical protein
MKTYEIVIIACLSFMAGMMILHAISHERKMAKLRSESLNRRVARFHAKRK